MSSTHKQLTIKVSGIPAPAGSFRAVKIGNQARLLVGGSDAGKKRQEAWRDAVKNATTATMLKHQHPGYGETQPLAVSILFIVPKPKSLPTWRHLPWTKSSGDIDKLCRCTLDALTDAKALHDDSRVIRLHAGKTYPSDQHPQPGALIGLSPLTEGQECAN